MSFQVTTHAPYGSLLKGQGKRSKRETRDKQEHHLKFIAGLPCLATGASAPCQAAHIRYTDPRYAKLNSGMQQKPHDFYAVPLSVEAHSKQHEGNESAFWEALNIDPLSVALQLWAFTGDQVMGERIIRNARMIAVQHQPATQPKER